jgi:hypothetical protein
MAKGGGSDISKSQKLTILLVLCENDMLTTLFRMCIGLDHVKSRLPAGRFP